MYFTSNDFDYTRKKFCNAIGCQVHTYKLQFFDAKYPISTRSYYIFNRQKLEEWFSCLCKENRLICNYCENCYTCERFHFIKDRILMYSDARDWPW